MKPDEAAKAWKDMIGDREAWRSVATGARLAQMFPEYMMAIVREWLASCDPELNDLHSEMLKAMVERYPIDFEVPA